MSVRAEIALLRFLRAHAGDTTVLNDDLGLTPEPRLPERLVEAALAVRSALGSSGGSAAIAALATVAAELAAFDPATLASRGERLAFWIDVYNALAVHAVAWFAPRASIREAPGFFHRAAYCIGGQRLSLEEIEHGVLRGNRPPLPGLPPPFAAGDPRRACTVEPPDARVHLALHCATRSCPQLHAYTAATLDADLDAAARGFLTGGGAEVEDGTLRLAALFDLYAADFGGPAGVEAFVLRYLPTGSERKAAAAAFAAGRVAYEDYDWALPATVDALSG